MRRGLILLVVAIIGVLAVLPQASANHKPTRIEVSIWLHGGTLITPLKDFENLIGVKFDGAKWYENWDDPWRSWIPHNYHSNGYIPELTWQPMYKIGDGSFKGVANDDIVAGLYDGYLDSMSANIKALPHRLRIAFAAEFNGDWNPWGMGKVGNNVENHKTAWRYIVNRFKANGVTNVDWIWTPNVDPFNTTPPFASMYPGNEYVTYFGLDGYNFSTTTGSYWMSFDQVFQSSYNQLQAIAAKDVYLIEVGSVEDGGDKAAWIKDMFEKLESGYPRIKGITWWNVAYPKFDMRIQTSQASIDQFRASVNGPAAGSGSGSGSGSSSGSGTSSGTGSGSGSSTGSGSGSTSSNGSGPTANTEPVTAAPNPDDGRFSLPSIIRQLTPDRSTLFVGAAALLLFVLTAVFYAVAHVAMKSGKKLPPTP